jgi:alanine racemase
MKKRSRRTKTDLDPRVRAVLSESALRGNYRALSSLVPGLDLLPMIKANAYGHGAVWAAETLKSMPRLRGFGVATIGEALELRREAKIPSKLPIVVFSGISPFTEERVALFAKENFVPVISTTDDWRLFSKSRFLGKLKYELKFNTGMNRLGLPLSLASELATLFAKTPKRKPSGVFSHLATAEAPDGELARKQLEGFLWLRGALSALEGSTSFHLANSGAMWNAQKFKLLETTDLARPGISLYGVPPWSGAPGNGVKLVMSLEARVMEVRALEPRDTVGYGGTYAASDKQVAVLSAGYADGVFRGLSNKGVALVGRAEVQARFAGIISMDLSAVELPEGAQAKVGDYVRVLGPGIEPWAQSRLAGTVPYELLTSVSGRVQRIYG